MSRLEELIQELCPDGVEFRPLGDLCSIKARIGWQRLNKSEYLTSGDYYLVTGVNITTDNRVDFNSCYYVSKKRYEMDENIQLQNGDIILTKDGTIGKVALIEGMDKPAVLNSHLFVIRDTSGKLNHKFLLHFLLSHSFLQFVEKNRTKGTIPGLNQATIIKFQIPVPPLPVQAEIVRILDNFMELTAELTAELAARKKQYEFYRDKLLSFDVLEGGASDCEQRILAEVANVFRGEYITKKSTKEGNIPVILGGQEPAYYIDKSNHSGEIVVIARSGVSAGFVSYWNKPIFITDGFGYEAKKGVTTPKFLYYILKNKENELNAMKRGAGVPHVSGEAIGQVLLPIPPLKEQERIISILDRFDTLCNDLTCGLPAEIKARQQQYEYYRDKLLSFRERDSI